LKAASARNKRGAERRPVFMPVPSRSGPDADHLAELTAVHQVEARLELFVVNLAD
jgi:hypothetical protein